MSGYTLSILLCMAAGLIVLAVGLAGLPPAAEPGGTAAARNATAQSAVEVAGAEVRPRRGAVEGDAPPTAVPPPSLQAAENASSAAPGREVAAAGTPSPTAGPTPGANERVRVAGTDGEGVVLHSAPQPSARLPAGFLEGWELTVLERDGTEWARVRGPNGREGWVRARYLASQP